MTINRTLQQIADELVSFYRGAQPKLTLAPGSVPNDLLIQGPAAETAKVYSALAKASQTQSLRLSIGSDIDKWASNIGSLRQRGAKSTVSAILTFNSLDSDLGVSKGDLIYAKNGSTFQAVNNLVISPVLSSSYKAIVSKYKADLDYLNITDQYAVELLFEATAPGTQGNISKYSLSSTSIAGINNVTNVVPAGGGKSAESDAAFKNRILAIFAGSNIGTSLGYANTVKSDPSVIDVQVITPGDPLMVRDGTQVTVPSKITDTPSIISQGTGGKVDIIVYGRRLQEYVDSFIYKDKSNKKDPTNSANDFVLGQITADTNKTISLKRRDNLATKILPAQPVNNIVSVVGSISGANFVQKSVDTLGRVTGNYELLKDTNEYSRSPWGFDKLHWISNKISDFPEDKTKTAFNSQDALSYVDVTSINSVQQNISITNENSTVLLGGSTIQLNHFPCSAVTRVFNKTNGERYIVSNQNPDGTGSINTTGRITITGATLPATSDKLQVDYTWIYNYDPYYDFDNKTFSFNVRNVSDSLDWGYSNKVSRERAILLQVGSYLQVTTTHPISAIASVNVFEEENAVVTLLSGRIAVTLSQALTNIVSIKRNSDSVELWNTINDDGAFNGLTAYLPTDTVAVIGDSVTVVYNAVDVYNASSPGNFTDNKITIVASSDAVVGTQVECNYISNINVLLPTTLLSNLPAIRNGNSFSTNISSSIGNQPTSYIFSGSTIVRGLRQSPSNLSLQITGLNSINESGGDISITGTTIKYCQDIVFTATSNGLIQDFSSAIKKVLGLTSIQNIPSNVSIGRLVKFEKVRTNSNLDVLEVIKEYDILGYYLQDNSFVKDESLTNSNLSKTQVELPSTLLNESNLLVVGDRVRARFYITTSSDSELVSFTKSGTQYTVKKYIFVDTISISSGFTSSTAGGAILTVTNTNQPLSKSRYKAFYDYTSPKTNERITVTMNYNKLIDDTTLLIETVRPINADVLLKEDNQILVDVIMNIVVNSDFTNSSDVVIQNTKDAISAALNVRSLAPVIDASDLVNIAYTVNGVDRARVLYFNINGELGSVLSISARKDQSIIANTVVVNKESR